MVRTAGPAEVLDFWFGELTSEQHFKGDDVVDRRIADRFGMVQAKLAESVPKAWTSEPRTILAAVIVLDQFSRNLYRDDPRAFANDETALALAEDAIGKGWDLALENEEKQFLYMPLMHSERLADVERCTDLMHAVGQEQGEEFARRHASVIARFGRYPGRNAALGRQTTSEEAAFLRENPHGF